MLDRSDDLALFGLQRTDDSHWSFELTRRLARLDGVLYGGTALGVAVLLGEVATDRSAIWSTVQFISGASKPGDRLDCKVEVLAEGHRTAQVRVTGFGVGGVELFCAVGATGHMRPGKLEGVWQTPPRSLPPEECERHRFPLADRLLSPEMREHLASNERLQDIRVGVPTDGYEPPPGEMLLWTCVNGRTLTPAMLGYVADLVPMSLGLASGRRPAAGTSIDNTVRFGDVPGDDDWVLAQLDPHLATGGYGHGTVHLWTRDGRLLATGTQTATMFFLD